MLISKHSPPVLRHKHQVDMKVPNGMSPCTNIANTYHVTNPAVC
jgi:hypothetical protein